jgi:hypothetical protein
VISVPDEIRTARMLLCKPRAADAPLMFSAYAQDPAVTRYLTWRPHADIAETRANRRKMNLNMNMNTIKNKGERKAGKIVNRVSER